MTNVIPPSGVSPLDLALYVILYNTNHPRSKAMNNRYFWLLFTSFLFGSSYASNSVVDSLLNVINTNTDLDESQLYDLHYQLGSTYGSRTEEKYEESADHYSKALIIARKEYATQKIADCLFGIGLSYQRRNNFEEALATYNKILSLPPSKVREASKPKVYTQVSTIYQALGDFQKAFDNQIKALLIYEINNDSLGIANANYNLGSIFYYQKRYQHALEYYQNATDLVNALGNQKFYYSCAAALGSVYEKLEDYDNSLKYNRIALKLAEEQKYKTGISYAQGNIAMNYYSQGQYAKAEFFLNQSISIKRELGDQFGQIGSSLDLSQVYISWEKPEKAIALLERALDQSITLDLKNRQSEIYKKLAAIYDNLGQHVESHTYFKKYVALKDSLLNEKTLEEIGQSQKRYEVQKREHEIELLTKENQLLGKDKKIQKLQVYIFAILSIAFILFLFWYRRQFKLQQQLNFLLAEKNDEIENQNEVLIKTQTDLVAANKQLEENNNLLEDKNIEIEVKNKQLENSNEDLKQFAYVASHDLKEPLRMIKSYTTLLQKRYNTLYDDTGKEFMTFVVDAVDRMETLLEDLLDYSKAGTQEAPKEAMSINEVIRMAEANLRHRLGTHNAQLIIRNQQFPSIRAHRTQLLQLLQNLISNGVKFKGEREPVVIIDGDWKENEYVVQVKDNGIGISKQNQKKVFEMFKRLHTREEYEGTGIGLATCKRIVNSWGGDIWIESTEGVGSSFFFSIPNYALEDTLSADPNTIPMS